MKFGKGIAFSMNSQFREGDHVLLDDEAGSHRKDWNDTDCVWY